MDCLNVPIQTYKLNYNRGSTRTPVLGQKPWKTFPSLRRSARYSLTHTQVSKQMDPTMRYCARLAAPPAPRRKL